MTCYFTPFLTVFQSSGRWEIDNERLFAMEHRLWSERFLPPAGLDPRPLDQQASALPTELPKLLFPHYSNTILIQY